MAGTGPQTPGAKAAFNRGFNAKFNARWLAAHPGQRGRGRGGAPKGGPRPAPAVPTIGGVAANNPLANPGVPLSGKSLLQAAQALATGQTAPTIDSLNSQIGQNDRQTQGAVAQTGGFFNQLGQQAQSGVNQQGQIAQGLNSQLQGIGADEQNQLRQIGQGATASLLKYAPQSDTSHSLGQAAQSSLATEIARQQGLAAQDQGAFRAAGATQGGNYQGLAASNLGTFGLNGQEALKNIAQSGQVRNEPLMSKLADAKAAFGPDFVTALAKLRNTEVTNNLARAGLGIKGQIADAATSNAATNKTNAGTRQGLLGVARQNATTNTRNSQFNTSLKPGSPAWARVQNAQGQNWSKNPNAVGSPAWARVHKASGGSGRSGGGAKPLTSNENNHFWGTVGQIEQLIRDGQGKGHNSSSIVSGLGNGQNPSKKTFDPFTVQVAFALMSSNGSISPSTAAILHNQYGVRGGTYNGRPIRVVNGPSTSANQQAQGIGSTLSKIF